MPNGTLCGKALAEMVLSHEAGHDASSLQEKMVKEGDLPRSYLITQERIDRARDMLTVQQQDELGVHMKALV